jgi:hypothetical protein
VELTYFLIYDYGMAEERDPFSHHSLSPPDGNKFIVTSCNNFGKEMIRQEQFHVLSPSEE